MRRGLPSLRTTEIVRALERAFERRCERGDFRLAHYSIQDDHVHMIVEADDAAALGRGMRSIGSGIALAVNRALGRRGRVLADRYHVRVLTSPREVRSALRYVLLNARKHAGRAPGAAAVDPASSSRWFDGWIGKRAEAGDTPCVARGRSWLLDVGWRRGGLLCPSEVPGRGP